MDTSNPAENVKCHSAQGFKSYTAAAGKPTLRILSQSSSESEMDAELGTFLSRSHQLAIHRRKLECLYCILDISHTFPISER